MPTASPRQTRQRTAVLEALQEAPEFRTAQQLYELLVERGDKVGLATVYRSLQTLADAGEIDAVRTPDGQAAYRLCGDRAHHHHLICRVCGRAVEIALDGFEAEISRLAALHGFTGVDHEIELFGLCPDCAATDR